MALLLRGRDEGQKETVVLHKSAMTFDWPSVNDAYPNPRWMGTRGVLTDVKNAHPSEFWMRMGFG